MDAVPKKYQNAGFRKDFKAKTTLDPFQNGGLDDEDASSVRPAFSHTRGPQALPQARNYQPEAKDFKRDHSRRNNVGVCVFSHHISLIRIY